MSDILEQLRLLGGVPWAIRAADEIARLRALLEDEEPVAWTMGKDLKCLAGIVQSKVAAKSVWGERAIALYLRPSPPPPGWRLVPEEPTEDMLSAAKDCQDADYRDGYESELFYAYKAMLSAAPQPPSKA